MRPPVAALGLVDVAGLFADVREIVQRNREVGMLAAERGFLNGGRLAQQARGLGNFAVAHCLLRSVYE